MPRSTIGPDEVRGMLKSHRATPTTCAEKCCAFIPNQMERIPFRMETSFPWERQKQSRRSMRWVQEIHTGYQWTRRRATFTGAMWDRMPLLIQRVGVPAPLMRSTRRERQGFTAGLILSATTRRILNGTLNQESWDQFSTRHTRSTNLQITQGWLNFRLQPNL